MPGFILDVQGLETTFKTPGGVMHAVNGVSFGLAKDETLSVAGERGNPGWATGVIGAKDLHIMFRHILLNSSRSLLMGNIFLIMKGGEVGGNCTTDG